MVWIKMFSLGLRVQSNLRYLLILSAVSVLVAGCDTGVAGAENSVDTDVVQAELVEQRLSEAANGVDDVAGYVQSKDGVDLSSVKPMLLDAAEKAFDISSMSAQILAAVTNSGEEIEDSAAFSRATAALSEGRKIVARAHVQKDEAFGKTMESRLSDPDRKTAITQVVDLMASPELAVENALSQQVVYAALMMETNATTTESDTASHEKLRAAMPEFLSALRAKTENERPYSKETAKLNEVSNLTFALATLSKEDISALHDFYSSPAGKAKRQSLVETYRQVLNTADLNMLEHFFDARADYLKKNPRVQ